MQTSIGDDLYRNYLYGREERRCTVQMMRTKKKTENDEYEREERMEESYEMERLNCCK